MPSAPLERPALVHAGLVVVASAWLQGGMGPNGEWIVAALASPAFGFLFAEARARGRAGDRAGLRRMLRWIIPLALLAALVLVSALNPSHRAALLQDVTVLRPVPHVAWLPASANPAGSLRVLACLGGLAATGLSLFFCVHSRQALRILVLVLGLDALALSILGTLQRQSGADGLFFGAIPAANERWFATFHYYNHWGAFAVLHAAATLGLVFHSLKNPPARGWTFGPGPLLVLAALAICATAPLSGSRSATALMAVLALAGAALAAAHVASPSRGDGASRRDRGAARRSRRFSLLALGLVLAAGAGLVFFQSREVILSRLAHTSGQLDAIAEGRAGYGRPELYADTWRMAADAPVFGWGLESYGRIFLRYSSFRPGGDGLMNTYEDAHSDWLQSLAETGFAGTLLLILFAALPLVETLRAPASRSPAETAWLLGGCALVAAYAWLEFPFACPAVAAAWWVFYFTALRLIRLSPATSAASSAVSPLPAPGS